VGKGMNDKQDKGVEMGKGRVRKGRKDQVG